jgi:hypothetical protein
VAIGSTHFAGYFEGGMQSAIQATTLKDEGLKEHTFVFIANCAKVMSTAFNPYLPNLVPYLLEVINESELSIYSSEDDEEDEDEDDDDVKEDDDEGGDYRLNIQEGFINSKKAALTAIGALAEHTKENFYPYIEGTLKAVLAERTGAICSLHGIIRAEAFSILQYIVIVAAAANGISIQPKVGEELHLSGAVMEISRVVLNSLIHCLTEDEEKLPVAESCNAIVGILHTIGIAALKLVTASDNQPLVNSLMHGILVILSEKAPCQTIIQEQDDGEDVYADHDNVVMDAVTDLIGMLAKVLKENFVPYFDEFQKYLLKFTHQNRTHSDRSMAIGCFAEVVAEIGPNAIKYAEALLPLIFVGLKDSMEGVRRNAAFCVGVLIENTGSALQSQYMNILSGLYPLCIRKEHQKASDSGGGDVDNALSAVARIIKSAPVDALPLDKVLAVLLAALPLREDPSEGPNIYQCLANLLLVNNPYAMGLLPEILSSFGETLLPSSNSVEGTKTIVKSCLQYLKQQSSVYENVVVPALQRIQNQEIAIVLQQNLQ